MCFGRVFVFSVFLLDLLIYVFCVFHGFVDIIFNPSVKLQFFNKLFYIHNMKVRLFPDEC